LVFGRRKKQESSTSTNASNDGNNSDGNIDFPWKGADLAPCNFAFGHLRDNLPKLLQQKDGGVHAETYASSIGCIAGFAAQTSAFEKMKQKGIPFSPPNLNFISTKNGKTYCFGDTLNFELCNHWEGEVSGCGLWPLAAGAASVSGVANANLPSLEAMFAHVSSQIGADKVLLRVGSHGQPMAPPEQLLNAVWPIAEMCFSGTFPNVNHEFGIASVKYRPIIASFLANKIIQDVKSVLPPETALTIVMESAILCSKLDPATVNSKI